MSNASLFAQYDDIVTVEQLADMLKIGRNTAYELVRAGLIPSVRVGRSIRIPKQGIIDYIGRNNGKEI